MCYGCYVEFNCPKIINEKTLAASELIAKLYEFAPSGGYLHIVTDDWNLDDDNLESCEGYIEENLSGNRYSADELKLQRDLLAALKAMTEEERASALAIWEGYLHGPRG